MAGDAGAVGGAGAGAVGGGGGSELAAVLQALADPARLRVVEALSRSPQRAGDLAVAAGVPAPTMSKHLRVLLAAGIVDRKSTRLNSSHVRISYAVFCLKKKKAT